LHNSLISVCDISLSSVKSALLPIKIFSIADVDKSLNSFISSGPSSAMTFAPSTLQAARSSARQPCLQPMVSSSWELPGRLLSLRCCQ
jgi:hypothetical protein